MQILRYNKYLLVALFSYSIFAEYRVYQYIVRATQTNSPKSYFITSTLDPISYMAYHGGDKTLKIDLSKTWTCLGNTGRLDICPDPLLKLDEQAQGNNSL